MKHFENNIIQNSIEKLDRPSNEQSIPNDDKVESEVEIQQDDDYVDDEFEDEKLQTEQKHSNIPESLEIHQESNTKNIETREFNDEVVDDMESIRLTNRNSDNESINDNKYSDNESSDNNRSSNTENNIDKESTKNYIQKNENLEEEKEKENTIKNDEESTKINTKQVKPPIPKPSK